MSNDLLPIGGNIITVSLSNQFGQSIEASSSFVVTLPPPVANPSPLTPSAPTSNSKTIAANELDSVSISDPSSPARGAAAIFTKDTFSADTKVTVEMIDPKTQPYPTNIPEPGSFGPVLKFGPSMKFKKPVIVGIPFDKSIYAAQKLSEKDLIVLHHHEEDNSFEVIRPYSVDVDRGIMYAETDSFSHFWGGWGGGSNTPYIAVGFSSPNPCLQRQGGQYCETRQRQIKFSGKVYSSQSSITAACEVCPGLQNININPTTGDFTIDAYLANDIVGYSIKFDNGSLSTVEKFTIAVVPEIVPPIGSQPWDTPGVAYHFAGTGVNGVSPDGSVAKSSPLNFYVNDYPAFSSLGITHDLQGRVMWVETKQTTLPQHSTVDLDLRRLGFDGKLETVNTFTLPSASGGQFESVRINEVKSQNANSDDYVLMNIVTEELKISGPSSWSKLEFNRLFKLSSSGVLSEIPVPIRYFGIDTITFSEPGFFYYRTFGFVNGTSYRSGNFFDLYKSGSVYDLYKVNINSNQVSLIKSDTIPYPPATDLVLPADGTPISNVHMGIIGSLKYFKNELYFNTGTLGGNCIMKFDSNFRVKRVAGLCQPYASVSGENIGALGANLGRVQSLDFDPKGNLYFYENQPVCRHRVVLSGSGILKTINGGGTSPTSPYIVATAALELKLLQRDSSFIVDQNSNLYVTQKGPADGVFIYGVAKTVPESLVTLPTASAPQSAPSTSVSQIDTSLESSMILPLLEKLQSQDGYWDFDQKYSDDAYISNDATRRLLATEKALEAFEAMNSTDSNAVEKALNWVANQEFESTSLIARQLAILSKYPNAKIYGSVRAARQNLLQSIGQRYRPDFSGWGSNEFSVTNHLDTSEAMSALASANSEVADAGEFTRMSNYQIVISRILAKQFDNKFGSVYSGGWGLLGPEAVPTMLVTTSIVETLIAYGKLNGSNSQIIASDKFSEFQNIKTVGIPLALQRAIGFLTGRQLANGSFGSVSETVTAIHALNKIAKSGFVTSQTDLDKITASLGLAVIFLNSTPLTTLDLGDVALLTDHYQSLNRNIAMTSESVPEILPQTMDPVLGSGKDGTLNATGVFNINENSSGKRRRPDGVSLPVVGVGTAGLDVSGYMVGDLAAGDEVIVFSAQGTNAGNYQFNRVTSIDQGSPATRIWFQTDLSFSFSSGDKLIVQRVPQYTSVMTSSSLVVTANKWNGKSGGIIALRVTGAMSNKVSVQATGLGFRGGVSSIANNIYLSSQGEGSLGLGSSSASSLGENGCGGGNASTAGPVASGAGTALGANTITDIFFGCGGGSGISSSSQSGLSSAGSGGGVIFLFANQYEITGITNSVHADGDSAYNAVGANLDLGSSGGSGGTILLHLKSGTISQNGVTATGGLGSSGPSGQSGNQGASGRIRINYSTLNTQNYPAAGAGTSTIMLTNPAAYGGTF